MSVTYPRIPALVAEVKQPSERAKRLVEALWEISQPWQMWEVAEAFLAEERQELLNRLAAELDEAEIVQDGACSTVGCLECFPPPQEEVYTGSESCS